MSLPSGTRLGHYEIVAPLGAGGMGEVFRATDPRLGRRGRHQGAASVLRQRSGPPRALRTRGPGARRAQSPEHYGFEEFTTNGGTTRALVMELLEGESLRDRLESAGPTGMPVRKAVEAAGQMTASGSS